MSDDTVFRLAEGRIAPANSNKPESLWVIPHQLLPMRDAALEQITDALINLAKQVDECENDAGVILADYQFITAVCSGILAMRDYQARVESYNRQYAAQANRQD